MIEGRSVEEAEHVIGKQSTRERFAGYDGFCSGQVIIARTG